MMPNPSKRRFRVSADIGGTFTDLVFQDAANGNTFNATTRSVTVS